MSLAQRNINFGRAAPQTSQYVQQQLQAQQQAQQQAAFHAQQQHQQQQLQQQQGSSSGLALPGPSSYQLPGSSFAPPLQASHTSSFPAKPATQPTTTNGIAGPSTPPANASTPAQTQPLTLEQQHITAVEGIIPTLQNIVATVNLDCRLDLKTIALHARNAEYNPKVSPTH